MTLPCTKTTGPGSSRMHLPFWILLTCMAASACKAPEQAGAQGVAAPSAAEAGSASPVGSAPANSPAPTAPQEDVAMHDDLTTFVPSGTKILDSQQGDLDGQGGADTLLVIEPVATGEEKLGEGKPRTVLLLTRDSSGSLRKAAENARIVPCASCGGLAGDPYAYARIETGSFTLSTSGGSRERWANDFTFRYSAERGTWLLDKVLREVTDTATEQHKALNLSVADFGIVRFEDFDPNTLPEVVLEPKPE